MSIDFKYPILHKQSQAVDEIVSQVDFSSCGGLLRD